MTQETLLEGFAEPVYSTAPDHERLAQVCRAGNPPLPEFLDWLASRMVAVYGENPDTDFVLALRRHAADLRSAMTGPVPFEPTPVSALFTRAIDHGATLVRSLRASRYRKS